LEGGGGDENMQQLIIIVQLCRELQCISSAAWYTVCRFVDFDNFELNEILKLSRLKIRRIVSMVESINVSHYFPKLLKLTKKHLNFAK